MEINSLIYFVSTYENLSISKSARYLNISPQGLSKSIKSLEEELDLILFTRSKHGLTPTLFGETFYTYANNMVMNYYEMKEKLDLMRTQKKELIKIGIANAVMSALKLELALAQFMSENSSVQIETFSASDSECEEMLQSDSIDFAFMMEPNKYIKTQKNLLYSEKIFAVMLREHRLSSKRELIVDDISEEPIICSDKHSRGYESLMKWYNEIHKKPKVVCTTNESRVYVHLVKKGIGIALVPEHLLDNIKDEEIVAIPLHNYRERNIYICYNPDRQFTLMENSFARYINEYYRK